MSNVVKLRNLLIQKKDPHWMRFRNQMKDLQQFDFEKLIEEIRTLHKTRSIRMLRALSQTSAKQLGDAVGREIAVRARCAEICMDVIVMRNLVNKSMSDLKKYIEAAYPKTLRDFGVTTVTARKNLLDALLQPYVEKTTIMETLLELADIVMIDVDQAGYSVKHLSECITNATRREFAM